MNRSGSETHRPARRSTVVRRNTRRLAAVTLIATATLATVHVDTAGAASCSLRVVDRDATSMTLRYDPPDNTSRTVWVDGQPHTIAPHDTAVVPAADTIMYPTDADVIVVDELIRQCGGPTTTTTSTSSTTTTTSTTSTVPETTTTTDALTTITVARTTPEPTTSTAPLPPATWTIADTPTTVRSELPATGASSGDIATVGLWVLVGGALVVAAVRDQIGRKDEGS